MSDKEHSTASLGNSEILSIKDSPAETIPAFVKRSEDGTKRPSAVDRQCSRNIFPNDPTGQKFASQPAKLEGKVTAFVIESSAEAGDTEGLARGASDENIDVCRSSSI